MKILCFTVNPIEENCYLLWDETTLDAAIIDCGAYEKGEKERIRQQINANHLQLCYLLQTHTHFDHIYGLPTFAKEYNLAPMCHSDDLPIYKAMPMMSSQLVGLPIEGELPIVRQCLLDGQEIPLGTLSIRVIHTPGHTPGGVCFWIESENCLFTGDTLFRCSLGRSDLPGGNMMQEKILKQNPDTGLVLGISGTGHLFLLENGGGWIMRNTRENLLFLLKEYELWNNPQFLKFCG